MSAVFYRVGIWFYGVALHFVSLFNAKAKEWILGRKNQSISKQTLAKNNRYWFHCASTGEFEQAKPLIKVLKLKEECTIIVSFFSPSGYNAKKNDSSINEIYYLPLDSPQNAKDFVRAINPTMVFVIKYEFWYYYFKVIKSLGIPLFIVSAHFKESQPFFKWYGSLFRKILGFTTEIFVQTTSSQKLLEKYGIKSIVAGDTRLDQTLMLKNESYHNKIIEHFKGGKPLVILGSVWPKDLSVLSEVINSEAGSLFKYLIVPHELLGKEELVKYFNCNVSYYSTSTRENVMALDVMVFDEMGYLSKLYRYANLVYIGGGFGVGIHNILEPIVYGVPVSFGPNHERFSEAEEVKKRALAKVINTAENFKEFLIDFYPSKPKFNSELEEYIINNKGATSKILSVIEKYK